jgi:hypothetical protein
MFLACLLLAQSCAPASDDGPEESVTRDADEDVEVQEHAQALTAGWITGPFRVSGNASINMLPDSTDVCVLTRVTGKFQGSGERVVVELVNGLWVLRSQSQQIGVAAEAHCFKKDQFISNVTRRVSQVFSEESFGSGNGCGQTTIVRSSWFVEAALYLNGISGKWEGGCELASVAQSFSPSVQSQLTLGSGQSTAVRARTASFSAGPINVAPKYFRSGSVDLFTSNSRSSVPSFVLAPITDAMCHFVLIQGDFNGGGEFAELRIGNNPQTGVPSWIFKTGSGSGSGITARVRCYSRDQR